MLKYVVLFVVCVVIALTAAEKRCEGVYFDKHIMKQILLFQIPTSENFLFFTQMAFNIRENTLYFFYRIPFSPDNHLGIYNMTTSTAQPLDNIQKPTCMAINQQDGNVYLGTTYGIVESTDGIVKNISVIQMGIQSMSVKVLNDTVKNDVTVRHNEELYFTDPMNKLRVWFSNNETVNNIVLSLPTEEIIYFDDNLFFTHNKSIFRLDFSKTLLYNYVEFHGKIKLLTPNADHTPYITTNDGVYMFNKYLNEFDKVSNIKNMIALTFNEAGEPIYIDSNNKIMQLKYQGCRLT